MRKAFLFLLLLTLLCSCVLDNSTVLDNSVGMVTFSSEVSRGITAFIEYPTLLDKTWTLTAEKLDSGGTIGEGTYEDVILTDSFGPFSVGSWRFTITDSEGKITGSTTAAIRAGNNTISISVHSTASKGTLIVENCDFMISKMGTVNYVDLYVDSQRVGQTNWVTANLTSEDGDYYVLPSVTVQLSEGIHTVRLYYGTDGGGQSSETVNVRIVKGMTTHFTVGETEGNLIVSVSFEEVSAIVE